MGALVTEITSLLQTIPAVSSLEQKEKEMYTHRLQQGSLLRSENPTDHFTVYFIPYLETTGEVLIIHHKKSGLWIFPGGHIEPEETIIETAKREVMEEVGVHRSIVFPPFFYSLTLINNSKQICKKHYDIWTVMPFENKTITLNLDELLEARWASIAEAKTLVTDENNRRALEKLQTV